MKKKIKKSVWIDPDDAPELTAEWFEQADYYEGSKLVRRGRPAGSGKKESATIRYDKDVLDNFKKMGKGWQTKINDALRDWLYGHAR